MRVLVVGATEVRSSDAPLLLARAFERLGCAVRVLPVATDLPFVAALGYDGGRTGDRAYQVSFNRHLINVAVKFEPDVVLLYGSNWCVFPDTVQRLQRRFGCQVALWEVNQWIWGARSASIPIYDLVFVLDSYFAPVVRVAGARRVEALFACADPEEHRPVELSAQELAWYGADVAFIGSRSDERAMMLREVAHHDLRVYGHGWIGVDPELAGSVRDEPVYGLKKTKVYAASRLSVNVHQAHMVNGENFRVFEVAACRGVSVSVPKPDLLACFQPGREVVVFEDAADLRRLVDFYVSNPTARDEIAEAARHRVVAEHTYGHRAETILDRLSGH